MRRSTVRVLTYEGGFAFWATSKQARRLLNQRQAKVVSEKPFRIQLVGIITTHNALIPINCRRFRREFEEQWKWAREHKNHRHEVETDA